jgi:lysophospholipase L1-like esterase
MADPDSIDRELADPYCIPDQDAVALLEGHAWTRFVVLGDSVAEGIGEPSPGYRDMSWTDRIASVLRLAGRPELVYENLGQRDLLAEAVRAQQLEPALAFGPDLALVVCGGNNCLRRSWDPESVAKDLREIVASLRSTSADVITVGLFDITRTTLIPQPMRDAMRERFHELAARTQAIAREHGAIHLDFTGHPASEDLDMYSSDLRHGTRRAHAVCASEAFRMLGARLR